MIRELLPSETGLAFEAMKALRTELTDEAAFVHRVDEVQRAEGFRVGHNLAWAHYLYVDDLSTRPESRHRGHGRRLLAWLVEEAKRLDCDQLHLDSGVGLDRADAHRLYLNSGLVIAAHHFARRVE